MAHSKEAHGKHKAIPQFNEGHWEKKMQDVSVADGKYSGEMSEGEDLKRSVDSLAMYAKKHKAKH